MMFDENSTKSAVVLRVNMRWTLFVATGPTSNTCGHKEGQLTVLHAGKCHIGGGHVNPQYDSGFARIFIKHHLTGKARFIFNSTKS